MSADAAQTRVALVATEVAKVPAFLRRDLLVAWSYRMAFFSDWAGLAFQVGLFYLIGLMVDPEKLPTFGGARVTYMEFVAVGIALGAFLSLALVRVAFGIRHEQTTGTLEALMMTPTSPATIQLGTVTYDLLYIPLRTAIFLAAIVAAFGLDFRADGILPATLILLAFIPFVWGIGVATAATTLTFRRGSGLLGIGAMLMTLGSGAFFPLSLLPSWATAIAKLNPMTVALDGMREALLAGTTWREVVIDLAILVPTSAASLAAGLLAFRLAMRRERRRGTLGLY